MRFYVEGYGSPMHGYDWFVSGERRSTKKQAAEDLKRLKADLKELSQLRTTVEQQQRRIDDLEDQNSNLKAEIRKLDYLLRHK